MEVPKDHRIQGQWVPVPVTPRKTSNLRDLIQSSQDGAMESSSDYLNRIPFRQLLGVKDPKGTSYVNAEPSNWKGDSGIQFELTGQVQNVINTRYNPSNIAADLDYYLSCPISNPALVSNYATNHVPSIHAQDVDTRYAPGSWLDTLNGYPLIPDAGFAESSSQTAATRIFIDDVNRNFLSLGRSNVERQSIGSKNSPTIPQYDSHTSFIPNLNSLPQNTITGLSVSDDIYFPQTPLPVEKNRMTMTQSVMPQSQAPLGIIDLQSDTSCDPSLQHFSNQVKKSQITTDQQNKINVLVDQSEGQEKSQGIDLKTPQQKPKRKKHRPKVVKEGRPAKALKTTAPKPSNANETANGKRKYTKKKKIVDTQGDPANIAVEKVHENAESSNKGAKRSLKFDEIPIQEPVNKNEAERSVLDFDLNDSLNPQQNDFARMVDAMASSISAGENLNRLSSIGNDKSTGSQSQNLDILSQGTKRVHGHVSKSQASANGYCVQSNDGASSSRESCSDLHKRMRIENFINSTQNGCNKDSTFADIQRMTALQNMQAAKSMPRNGCEDQVTNNMNCLGTSTPGRMNCGTQGLASNTINYGSQIRAPNTVNFNTISTPGRMNNGVPGQASNMIHCHKISSPNTINNGNHVRAPNTVNFNTFSTPSRMNNGVRGQASSMIHCHNIPSTNTLNNGNHVRAQPPNAMNCNKVSSSTVVNRGSQAQPPNAIMNCYQPSTPEKAPHIHNNGDKSCESYGQKALAEAQVASKAKLKARTLRKNEKACVISKITNDKQIETYKPSGVLIKYTDPIDALARKLGQLNINYSVDRNVENALVPYTTGVGTMVPYTNPQDLLKKKKPRPKVDLDPESDRVWKLLMGLEDDDGSNIDKEKWWEEERRVFRGRADSFIARMHLIQGNRKFSKWKGSVVDSVIGVFLTQNVSDHLSSSAFMSLAARFPLKTNVDDSSTSSNIIRSPIIEVDDDCCSDLSNKLVTKELLNSQQSLQCNSDFNQVLRQKSPDSVLTSSDIVAGSTNAVEFVDVLSSPNSIDSSQNLFDFPKQTISLAGPTSLSNFEAIELLTGSGCSGYNSFTELLQMADDRALHNSQVSVNNDLDWSSFSENLINCSGISNVNSAFSGNFHSNPVNSSVSADQLKENSVIRSEVQVGRSEKSGVSNPVNEISKNAQTSGKPSKGKAKKVKNLEPFDWDSLRRDACQNHGKKGRSLDAMDSLDYESLRQANINEVSKAIKERGMNIMLADRIKAFLDRLVKDHGSIDLEWLRNVPPEKAKDYLLSIRGLGLKSVECVRLLTLHHLAFPVDTNVGRIAVRLGWVPLQPLPESLQLHLLEMYPMLETIQKYLWPRLCKLDQHTLYELHYQLITFGKVFCTKSKPNCNSCPMRAECKHFASAFASARLALPGLEEKRLVSSGTQFTSERMHRQVPKKAPLHQIPKYAPFPQLESSIDVQVQNMSRNSEPIIEEPASPEAEPEYLKCLEQDIEDAFYEGDVDEIPMIKLNIQQFTQNLENYMHENNMPIQEGELSKALVAVNPQLASIPTPKLKNISRLRTEHSVYQLPDDHEILEGFDKRDPDDPTPYLLAIWAPGETAQSIEAPTGCCNTPESGQMCGASTCFSCNSLREAHTQTIRGTILIPCRTANRGSFPLNGTYFQVNEVFADHESSREPIQVPRRLIWNLERRTVCFGSSVTSIFKGLRTEEIQQCFWRGFVCVRGFDRAMRSPKPLFARLHFRNKKPAKKAEVKL